jgi:hypothetical protein
MAVDELARHSGLPGDPGDRDLAAAGEAGIDRGGDAFSFELGVESPLAVHRDLTAGHELASWERLARGLSVGRGWLVASLRKRR